MSRIKLSWSKRSLISILSVVIIVCGVGCIVWSIFSMRSQSSYYNEDTNIGDFIPEALSIKQIKIAEASTSSVESHKPLYRVNPIEGDNIGSLTIPALNRKTPIIQGTGVEDLKKGVGHFAGSVLPGEQDNCVLSGHRDTVFRQLGKVKLGDKLIVKTSAGNFTYEVNGTRIVHENDKTVIVPTDHAVLTLTTCYPFYAIGNAPDRYIVSAILLENN